MSSVHHIEDSRDCLYDEVSQNLETVYSLWLGGQSNLRFAIPVLGAVKLEAFINVAGKLNVPDWDSQERRLTFKAKCKSICSILAIGFDTTAEPNKTALEVFEIRNSLVHPKMHIGRTDERISEEEYEKRRAAMLGVEHPLRSSLTANRVTELKTACDAFTLQWGSKLLGGQADYWLRWGSTGGFTFLPNDAG
jgi:hypothetical protein